MSARRFIANASGRRLGIAAMMFAFPVPLVTPDALDAQQVGSVYRISQRATVSQKLGETLVTIDYSRPLARGRSPLFGGPVHWGEIWTPGANEATVLELSHDAKLEGHDVPAGRWSVWMIPSNVGPWEMLLDPADSLFHTQRPDLGGESQIRFPLRTAETDHVEALTWSFPRVAQDGATIEMAWGKVKVPLEIEVESTAPVTEVPAEEAALYTGEWSFQMEVPPEAPPDMPQPPLVTVTIRQSDDGSLLVGFPAGAFGPPPAAEEPAAGSSAQERERAEAVSKLAEQQAEAFEYVLVPRARGIFIMAYIEDGVLLDVEEIFHEFEFEDGEAVRMTMRDGGDNVFGIATRNR